MQGAPSCGLVACISSGSRGPTLSRSSASAMRLGKAAFITSTDVTSLLTARDAKRMAVVAEHGDVPGSSSPSRGFLSYLPAVVSTKLKQLTPGLEKKIATVAEHLGFSDTLSETALSLPEVRRLFNFEIEATIPEHLKAWCPRCKLVLMLPEPRYPPISYTYKCTGKYSSCMLPEPRFPPTSIHTLCKHT